jgi:hypothetical protein
MTPAGSVLILFGEKCSGKIPDDLVLRLRHLSQAFLVKAGSLGHGDTVSRTSDDKTAQAERERSQRREAGGGGGAGRGGASSRG